MMETNKIIITKIFICAIVALFIFSGCRRDIMCTDNRADIAQQCESFPRLLNIENIYDMTLTIHYICPTILTRTALSAERLISMEHANRIVVYGSNLVNYVCHLNKINTHILVPVSDESRLNARLVYVFETAEEGRVLMVAAGLNNSVFVNGSEYEFTYVLFDAIKPFMPEESLNTLNLFFRSE